MESLDDSSMESDKYKLGKSTEENEESFKDIMKQKEKKKKK